MFSASITDPNGVTCTISGDTFGEFFDSIKQAHGLHVFAASVAEMHTGEAEKQLNPLISPASTDTAIDDVVPSQESDELAYLIFNAPDVKTLEGLWKANRDKWDGRYNQLADKRKKVLVKKK